MRGKDLHLIGIRSVVVFVSMWSGLTIQQKHPCPSLSILAKVLLVAMLGGCSRKLVIEFRGGHEVVDGLLNLGLRNDSGEGAMEHSDHSDLYRGKEKDDEKIRMRIGQQTKELVV
jgi:hypothetical protein